MRQNLLNVISVKGRAVVTQKVLSQTMLMILNCITQK